MRRRRRRRRLRWPEARVATQARVGLRTVGGAQREGRTPGWGPAFGVCVGRSGALVATRGVGALLGGAVAATVAATASTASPVATGPVATLAVTRAALGVA